jgi:hypothetical protein
MLHEALDRAAFAGRVPPFAEDDQSLPRLLQPCLQFQELSLQDELLILVIAAQHFVFVGVAAPPIVRQFVAGGQLTAFTPGRVVLVRLGCAAGVRVLHRIKRAFQTHRVVRSSALQNCLDRIAVGGKRRRTLHDRADGGDLSLLFALNRLFSLEFPDARRS